MDCIVSNNKSSIRVIDLFSGIGGFSLGLQKASNRYITEAFCEIDSYCRGVLLKNFPQVTTVYEDVRDVMKGKESCDLIVGGFPCQDVSMAGRREGISGERSSLWKEFKRIIKTSKPKVVLIENVAAIRSKGLTEVLQDLWEIGYDAEWNIISAASIGAPHLRDRCWIIAYPSGIRLQEGSISKRMQEKYTMSVCTCWGKDKPGVVRTLDGVPNRVDRTKSLGNAVVPQVVELLGKVIEEEFFSR